MSAPVSGTNTIYFLSDPFGNSYGYSTAEASLIASGSGGATTTAVGYNATFDLWSTGGQTATPYPPATSGTAGDPMLQWVKNW